MVPHIHEVQLSAVQLTANERSGIIARSLGLSPARQHLRSSNEPISPASVRFVHPALPSQHHPLPRRC
jgi:hypothetical protein